MGCGGSKIMVVQPVLSSELNGDGEDTGSKLCVAAGLRGDSAVSKFTTDSGVVLETGEALTLPGAVTRILPPLAAQDSPTERPESSEILEQLLNQGIIPAQPRDRPSVSGEAYNIMMDDGETPRRRPPPRLESLKARKDQPLTSKEDIEDKMRHAEERRKLKEEELRLRIKSGRVRAPTSAALEEGSASCPLEVLQTPPVSHTRPCPADQPTGLQDPPLQTHTLSLGREAGGEVREGGGGSRDGGGGGRDGGGESRDGAEIHERARDGDSPPSLEMESDSTFQQTEQVEEIF